MATKMVWSKCEVQVEIERRAKVIAKRLPKTPTGGTFGEYATAIGLDMADYRQLCRMTAANHSGAEALAWVEMGRPEIKMYSPCSEADIPVGIRFDVPPRNQGQIVEVSYGTFGRGEASMGDLFMCRHDRSDGSTDYYRLTWR